MKNKTIAIVCAMDVELNQFNDLLAQKETIKILNRTFVKGSYLDNTVVLAKMGIGKVSAASLITLLIEHFNPDLVINSGIAGGYLGTKTLDVVIAERLIYSDADMTDDNFTCLRYGQLQDQPEYFLADIDTINLIKGSDLGFNCLYGDIASGDQFVTNFSKCKALVDNYFKDLNILAFDMESTAVAQVCNTFNTKFLIVRAISDVVGSNDPFEYSTFSEKASNKASKIVRKILENN